MAREQSNQPGHRKNVMIVDDKFAENLRSRYVSGLDHETEKNLRRGQVDDGIDLRSYLRKNRNPSYFDLTREYQDSGGRKDINLLVLGEPQTSVHGNAFYKKSCIESMALSEGIFDVKKALNTIREVNPDILLIDLGFYAPTNEQLVEDFVTKYSEKKKDTFSLKPDSRTSEIDFPPQTERGFLDLLGYERGGLGSQGGVNLAHELQGSGRNFSFWTNDLHHAAGGLGFAYTLDFLSREELSQVVGSDNAAYRELHENWEGIPVPESEKEAIEINKKTPVSKSDNGRVIVADKGFFYRDNGGLIPTLIPKLNEVIGTAEKNRTYNSQ